MNHFVSINPFPNKPWFLHVCSTSLLKTLWEKEKLLVKSSFSFSHSVFLHVWILFCCFHQIWNCRLQTLSVWKSLKFVVWERVKLGRTRLINYLYACILKVKMKIEHSKQVLMQVAFTMQIHGQVESKLSNKMSMGSTFHGLHSWQKWPNRRQLVHKNTIFTEKLKNQEGHDGPVSLHWLIPEIHYITWELV